MDIGSKAGYYTSKSPKLHLLEVKSASLLASCHCTQMTIVPVVELQR